jgi:transcriptional regulator with XRE-family HTH domain
MFNTVKIKDVKLSFGNYVKSLRKRHSVTQHVLAEQLGVSRITIQNLESGKNFTIDTLLKVLQYFDVLDDLNKWIMNKTTENEDIVTLY